MEADSVDTLREKESPEISRVASQDDDVLLFVLSPSDAVRGKSGGDYRRQSCLAG